MTQRVLFVHAHPQDDSLSTIANLAERGASVTVLTGTRDETVPEAEFAASLTDLGAADSMLLGSPRARWEGRAERRYHELGSSEPGEVASDVAAAVISVQPDVVVSYDADGGDGHPEHVLVHEATRTATAVLGVPFYVIRAPKGQGAKTFHRLRPVGNSFADYGIVTRIFTCVLALILGVFVGATLTVVHQATVEIAGVRVPWGIIAAIVITAALIVGLRLVFETRIVPGIAALGLLGASAFLAVQSSGGSILVPDNLSGYIWTFAPVLIAGVALAWPQVHRKAGSNIGGTSAKGSVS